MYLRNNKRRTKKMKITYTPGPWNTYGNELSPTISISEDGTKPALARVTGRDMQSNARLIAAAPELLEALRLFLHDCEDEGLDYNTDTYRAAKAAITKATAQTNEERT
jgi:hypothetical protein